MGAAREYLLRLDLHRFSTPDADTYRVVLDQVTAELQEAMPRAGGSWGVARKILNIFIRDASYHVALNEAYRLAAPQRWMEMPLDSLTATGLKRAVGRGRLPQWPGVKHLDPTLSDRFQAAAAVVAEEKDLMRVDLDVIWWGLRR
ncbi:MAG: hypothetical protein Q8P50_04120 [Bacillota bacterium]|nr:hypothetical protein [Bacillota bacterium]